MKRIHVKFTNCIITGLAKYNRHQLYLQIMRGYKDKNQFTTSAIVVKDSIDFDIDFTIASTLFVSEKNPDEFLPKTVDIILCEKNNIEIDRTTIDLGLFASVATVNDMIGISFYHSVKLELSCGAMMKINCTNTYRNVKDASEKFIKSKLKPVNSIGSNTSSSAESNQSNKTKTNPYYNMNSSVVYMPPTSSGIHKIENYYEKMPGGYISGKTNTYTSGFEPDMASGQFADGMFDDYIFPRRCGRIGNYPMFYGGPYQNNRFNY